MLKVLVALHLCVGARGWLPRARTAARGVSRAAAELEELAPIGVLRDSMPYLAVNAELLADDFEYEGPLASGPVRRDAYLDLAARLEREDTA